MLYQNSLHKTELSQCGINCIYHLYLSIYSARQFTLSCALGKYIHVYTPHIGSPNI